jgi:ABC-type sugar transport system permease subunit
MILPFLKPAILVVAAFEAFLALTNYDLVFSFAGGEFGLISYYSFAELFTYNNFGYGAALSVILALMSIAVIIVILRIVPPKKLYKYSFTGD